MVSQEPPTNNEAATEQLGCVSCQEGFHLKEDDAECLPNDQKDEGKIHFVPCDGSWMDQGTRTCLLCSTDENGTQQFCAKCAEGYIDVYGQCMSMTQL